MYLSKEAWKDKGFNDFYQKLWYYQDVTFKPEQTEKELLQLSEAYFIFKDFEDDEQIGICLSNIGAIMC